MTEEHLLLLADLYIGWNDYAYDGSPGPGDKRPFGNSDWEHDIHECLGWDWPDEDEVPRSQWDDLHDLACARAKVIYRELEYAMAIVLKNIGCPREQLIGPWAKASIFSSDPWTKVAV
jgi:hypothetical protein